MLNKLKNFIFGAGVLMLAVGLVACGEVALHHELNEIEADKIMVLLDNNDISATKVKEVEGQDVSWTVKVPQGDVSKARRLLVENNLPHRAELGLSGVYKEKGLIPTPDEQKARFLLALKGEIINALRKIPGVYEVGVVLNMPDKDAFAVGQQSDKAPSASVVLRVGDPELIQTQLSEEKVRRFVANAIPEMSPQDVIVIISTEEGAFATHDGYGTTLVTPPPKARPRDPGTPFTPPPLGGAAAEQPAAQEPLAAGGLEEVAGLQIGQESMGRFRIYIIAFLCVLILLSGALLFTLFRFSRVRRARGRRLHAVPGGEGGPEMLPPGGGTMGVGPGPGETGTGR